MCLASGKFVATTSEKGNKQACSGRWWSVSSLFLAFTNNHLLMLNLPAAHQDHDNVCVNGWTRDRVVAVIVAV